MPPFDIHPATLADLRRVGDAARWQCWAALRDWTLRLWAITLVGGGLVLRWSGDDLRRGLLHLLVVAGSTLIYRELYLFHWACRLRLPLRERGRSER
jgi:hypothetical protein